MSKAIKGQKTNLRMAYCQHPTINNTIHGISISKGNGHLVELGNTYVFYCEECFNNMATTTTNNIESIRCQDLAPKKTIKENFQHQISFVIATKDIATIQRLKRNNFISTRNGNKVTKLTSAWISNLNGIQKQFDAIGLQDRKVIIKTTSNKFLEANLTDKIFNFKNGIAILKESMLSEVIESCKRERNFITKILKNEL